MVQVLNVEGRQCLRSIGLVAGMALILTFSLGAAVAYAQEGSDTGAASVAESTGADGPLSREEVLQIALGGDDAGLDPLINFLATQGGDRQGVAALAADMIGELGGDPEDVRRVAGRISDAATEAMNASVIERFSDDESFSLPEGAFGFDFATADAKSVAGYERVTPNDSRVEGDDMSGLRRPVDSPVVAHGLTGIRKFRTAVPNGRYRIVLITDDLGDWSAVPRPLGNQVRVNDATRRVLTKNPGDWVGSGAGAEGGTGAPGGVGGAIIIEIEVTDGFLYVEFLGDDATFLAGLIVEPIDEFEEEDPFDAEEEIAAAIAESVAKAVTEAGEEEDRNQTITEEPALEDDNLVSPT
jgi:hypothetical protein